MPNDPKSEPKTVIGDKNDVSEYELTHQRSVAKNKELYCIRWSSGVQFATVGSDEELAELEASKKFKKVKKASKPDKERYRRNDIEPLRI